MIRNVSDTTKDGSSALAVYLALTEIASDEESDKFTKSISEIATRSGVRYRTASKMLSRFEALKILKIERNTIAGTNLQAPNTYTLGNGCLSLGNGKRKPMPRGMKKKKKNGCRNEKMTSANGKLPAHYEEKLRESMQRGDRENAR